jgi:hypothetical protein
MHFLPTPDPSLTGMRVPEMSTTVGVKLVSERVSLVYGTLGDVWHAIAVLRVPLVKSVPMDDQLQTLHVVQHINDYLVSFADLRTTHSHSKNKTDRNDRTGGRDGNGCPLDVGAVHPPVSFVWGK